MKKIITFLFILSIFSSDICFSQSGWFWVNPVPTGKELRSIRFVNENVGFAVGAEGTFLKTTNSGENWTLQKITDDFLWSVYFVNEQTGFVCGQGGLILKTTNGGISWNEKASNTLQTLNSIYFPNLNSGYAVGYGGTMLKTVNNGEVWNVIPSGLSDNLKQIQFVNDLTGYVCGSYCVGKTINAGINWSIQYYGSNLNSMYFIDEQNGHVCGDEGLFVRTTNGGENWEEQIEISWCSVYSIFFTNVNTGFASGFVGTLFKTTNAGVSWFTEETRVINYLYSLYFTNSNLGWVAGDVGCILRTKSGSDRWLSQTGVTNTLLWMEFPSENVGYICGGSGTMLVTTNGGNNWDRIRTPIDNPLWKLRAPSENVCYACTDTVMIKTTNRGLNWNIIIYDSPGLGESFDFPDELNGFAYGGSDFISRTTDGGLTWFNQPNGLPNSHIWPAYFLNSSTGFGSHDEKFYYTTNSGVNWTLVPLDIYILENVYFLNSFTGYLACGNEMIYKTTNRGQNWTGFNTGAQWLQKVVFPDVNTGYALGDNDYVIKTTNGGLNWIELPRPITPELHDIDFLTPEVGFMCGYGGAILKTTTGGIIVGPVLEENQIPSSPSLAQNYPNPFNPVTRIKFSLPNPSKGGAWKNVRLVIYDILGREIATLIPPLGGGQEGLKPGSYEVTWDGSRYASGVYFYKLVTDEYVETRKMVLIK